MIFTDKYMRFCNKHFLKFQLIILYQLQNHIFIVFRKIKNPNLTFSACHIFNDLARLCLSYNKTILVCIIFFDQINKSIYRK